MCQMQRENIQEAIFGKPVIEDEFIGEGQILYGLFDKYTINWNENVNVTSDDSAEFRSGNRVYRGMALVDGKTVNTEAFVLIKKKASTPSQNSAKNN